MPSRVTLDLTEWFGALLKVNKRSDQPTTSITIPSYLSEALGLENEEPVRIYIEKKHKRQS